MSRTATATYARTETTEKYPGQRTMMKIWYIVALFVALTAWNGNWGSIQEGTTIRQTGEPYTGPTKLNPDRNISERVTG